MNARISISDAETVRLARQLADELGQSVDATIRAALEEKIARGRNAPDQTVADVMAIVRNSRGRWNPQFDGQHLSITHGELLYDEDGLPK
jgi:antitoxin VapB